LPKPLLDVEGTKQKIEPSFEHDYAQRGGETKANTRKGAGGEGPEA